MAFFCSPALKSVLRKTRSNVANAPSSTGSSPKDANKVKPEAGYDFIEGSGFVIEGLEDKGLDAKSYIQQMLRRTDGSSREEQIIQKVCTCLELVLNLYRTCLELVIGTNPG